MKRLLIFDNLGYYKDEDIVSANYEVSENEYLAALDEVIAFHKPKLVNGKVVEGRTKEDILEEKMISSLIPSGSELEAAEFEIKILTLLFEMEVI